MLKNNTAGSISVKADNQFLKAKEKTGDFGDKLIDVADSSAETLGYSIFGFKSGDYMQTLGEGLDIYRDFREQGYSKEEAIDEFLATIGISVAKEKLLDKGKIWIKKQVPKANTLGIVTGKEGIVDRADDYSYNDVKSGYLQKKLDYSIMGENSFVPEGTKFKSIKTIAGKDADKPIYDIDRLVNKYGGKEEDWRKKVGLVESDKYKFDIHWYECNSIQYDVKLKRRSTKK